MPKPAPKPASKKAAPIVTEGAARFDDLYIAPENARFGQAPQDIDALAANIAACGLLTPLLGYRDEEGRFAIAGGARRFAALGVLRQASTIAPGAAAFKLDWDAIPTREIAREHAAAASLAENTQRVDLTIVEAAIAWHRMTLDGRGVPEIAKAFGQTERFVQSRLKLASLHEPILEALRSGEISLDVAQAYATAHMSRQEKVWKALGKQRASLSRIKDELKKNTLLAGDGLAKFVGEEAYAAAGGQIEQELFQSPDMSRWLDPALAERLAQEKLRAKAAELEAEGFLFVESAIEVPHGKYVDGNLGKPRKPTAEEKAALKKLDDESKALSKEADAIEKASDERGDATGDYQYTEAEDERLSAIDERQLDIREARDQLEDTFFTYDDAAKKKSGVIVTLSDDGRFVIERGRVAPKERKATPAGKSSAKTSGKAASTKPAAPEPQAPMTNLTHEKTSRIASAVVGRALAQRPDIALIAVTAALARQTFADEFDGFGEYGALTLRGAGQGSSDTFAEDGALLSAQTHDAARKRFLLSLGKPIEKLEGRMTTWPQAEVLALLAFCVGESVKVIEPSAERDYRDDDARASLMLLGRLAGANPAAHFIADAEYLGGFSKPSLEAAAAELEIDSAGIKTKAALAARIADAAKGAGATAAWTPPLLRKLCGVEEPPKPKPAAKAPAAKKAAKKTAAKKPAKKIAKQPAKKVAAKGAGK